MSDGLNEAKNRYPKEWFDFHTEYQSIFGCEPIEMMSLLFGILGHYLPLYNTTPKDPGDYNIGENFFSTIVEPVKSKRKNVFNLKAQTISNLQEMFSGRDKKGGSASLIDTKPIYDKPLLELDKQSKDSPSVYTPLDMEYIERAATEGLYWDLFNYFLSNSNKKKAYALRAVFGRAVEWYASSLIRDVVAKEDIWLDWDGDFSHAKTKISIPDVVVREDDTLFVFECTSSSIQPSISLSGDPVLIENALGELWFGSDKKGEVKKLLQLNSTIEAIKKNDLTISNVDISKIQRIVPVFVTFRSLPQYPNLRNWYDELMRNNGLSNEFISRLLIIGIDDLEALSQLKKQGIDFIETYIKHSTSAERGFSINHYLMASNKFPRRIDRLDQESKKIMSIFGKLLFNNPNIGQVIS